MTHTKQEVYSRLSFWLCVLKACVEVRRELGAVMYAPNVLGSRGPRKMQVCIPAVDESNSIVTWRQQKVCCAQVLCFA